MNHVMFLETSNRLGKAYISSTTVHRMQTKHPKQKWMGTTTTVRMNHFRINGLRIKLKRDRALHDSRWGLWRGGRQRTQNLITWILNTCRFRQRWFTDPSSENTDPKYSMPKKLIELFLGYAISIPSCNWCYRKKCKKECLILFSVQFRNFERYKYSSKFLS